MGGKRAKLVLKNRVKIPIVSSVCVCVQLKNKARIPIVATVGCDVGFLAASGSTLFVFYAISFVLET